MVSTGTDDDLGLARAEVRQLRETVDELRAALEAAAVGRNAAVQNALAQSADEVARLKESVAAMRTALETTRREAADEREAIERAFRAEREQLHEIIGALRSRLEASDDG
jgi:hypothetical protein